MAGSYVLFRSYQFQEGPPKVGMRFVARHKRPRSAQSPKTPCSYSRGLSNSQYCGPIFPNIAAISNTSNMPLYGIGSHLGLCLAKVCGNRKLWVPCSEPFRFKGSWSSIKEAACCAQSQGLGEATSLVDALVPIFLASLHRRYMWRWKLHNMKPRVS